MFLYYRFLKVYGREPIDPDDLFDGMRNIVAEAEIEKG
jgi:hypothetical protein